MQIVWDRQAWDLSTCKRREKMRDLEMMAHMQHEIDDLKKRLQQEQSLRKRLEAENFQLKLRRKLCTYGSVRAQIVDVSLIGTIIIHLSNA